MGKLVVVLGSLFILILLFGCTSTPANDINKDSQIGNTTDNNPITPADINNNASTGPVTHSVDIRNYTFTPSTVTIKQGDIVIWRNYDSMGHTVTGGELDSSIMQNGMTYTHTFNNRGTIDYICTPHPYMKGKVIVE